MSFAPGLDAGSVASAASYIDRPAEEYINDATVEQMWVMRAVEYAEIHFNLISSVDPKLLKLTKKDDDRIYTSFRTQFKDFDVVNIPVDELKSESAKEKWRQFCETLKDIEDYSFGTLLRLNCLTEYSEENTILVTRIQFLAIEITRNRMGYNNTVYQTGSKLSSQQSGDKKEQSS